MYASYFDSNQTIYVIDDDRAYREAIVELANSMGVAAQAFPTAEDFLQETELSEIRGCVVTELRMRGMSGLQLIRSLRVSGCDAPVIVLTAYADVQAAVEVLDNDRVSLMEKPYRDQALWDAIVQALNSSWERDAEARERRMFLKRINTLTDDELQVMEMMAIGHANKQIASHLDICLRTVDNRRRAVLEKLGVNSVQAMIWKLARNDYVLSNEFQKYVDETPRLRRGQLVE